MTTWRPADCLLVIHAQLDAAFPDRPRGADGMIGDAAHQAEQSDHNPNAAGVVTAFDITTASFSDELAEELRRIGPQDGRVKYVIWQRRITSAVHGWQWAPYDGQDPHTGHIHLSVSADPAQYDRNDPWPLPIILTHPEDDVTNQDKQDIANLVLKALYGTSPTDSDPTHVSLADLSRKLDVVIQRLGA